MARYVKAKCDRCGKEQEPELTWEVNATKELSSYADMGHLHFDLCQECMNELLDWLDTESADR
jgi:methionyl-tRNA synthetase